MARSFFDKVVDVLNTPLPGTGTNQTADAPAEAASPEESIFDKIRKGLERDSADEATTTAPEQDVDAAADDDEPVDFEPDFAEQDYAPDDDDDDDGNDDPEDPVAPAGRRRVQDALRREHERELQKIRDEHTREMGKIRAEHEREARKQAREHAKKQREHLRENQKREREALKKQLKAARKAAKGKGKGKGRG